MMKAGVDYVGVGVGALILRDNRALMLLRSERCRNNRHQWTIPDGGVELFESLEAAVGREVLEETGLKLRAIRFLTVSDRQFDGQHWVSILYSGVADGDPRNLETGLHEKMEWLDIDGLPEDITPPTRDAIGAYRRSR